jgi:hypothetical protein
MQLRKRIHDSSLLSSAKVAANDVCPSVVHSSPKLIIVQDQRDFGHRRLRRKLHLAPARLPWYNESASLLFGLVIRPRINNRAMSATLHQRILGDSFLRLPPPLRAFHGRLGGGRASGRFELVRTRGWLQSCAAWVMRLAPAGSDVPTRLEVVVDGDRERWVRHFGSHSLITIQQEQGGLLAEDLGKLRFMFQLTANENGLRFVLRRVKLFSLPLPLWLAPSVSAIVTGRPHGWHVKARIGAPLLGTLLRYHGSLRPDDADDEFARREEKPEARKH